MVFKNVAFILLVGCATLLGAGCASPEFEGRYEPSQSPEELRDALSSFSQQEEGWLHSVGSSESCVLVDNSNGQWSSLEKEPQACLTVATPDIFDRGIEGYEVYVSLRLKNWFSDSPALCNGFELHTLEFVHTESGRSCDGSDSFEGAGITEVRGFRARPASFFAADDSLAVESWKALNRMIGEDSRFVLRDVEGTTYTFEFSADSHLNTELRKTFDAIAALEQGLEPE